MNDYIKKHSGTDANDILLANGTTTIPEEDFLWKIP
jgi:hypothetical protein